MTLEQFEALEFEKNGNVFLFRPVVKRDRDAVMKFGQDCLDALRGPFPLTYAALVAGKSEVNSWMHTRLINFREKRGILCVIEEKQSKRIVGFVSAFQFEWRTPKCEMSWMVNPEFQRQKIAITCCRHMIQFLFQDIGLAKVLCRIQPENAPSLQLAAQLGFQKEGTHQFDFRDGYGKLVDVCYFGLLA